VYKVGGEDGSQAPFAQVTFQKFGVSKMFQKSLICSPSAKNTVILGKIIAIILFQ